MDTKRRLCEITDAPNVEILLGSGTLANDMVAAQLSVHSEPGLILSNGEFGDRLIDHARRFGLHAHRHTDDIALRTAVRGNGAGCRLHALRARFDDGKHAVAEPAARGLQILHRPSGLPRARPPSPLSG